MYMIIQDLTFFVWLTSLSIMSSRFLYVVADGRMSFLFVTEFMCVCVCACMCMHLYVYSQFFFICSSVSGHVDCFYVLAIVDNAALNIGL